MEKVFAVDIELVNMADRRIETVLEFEVCLQLARHVVPCRVPQSARFLSEFFFATSKSYQYCRNLSRVRDYLMLLNGQDKRLKAINRVRQRRTLYLCTVDLLRTDRFKQTQRNRPQVVELGGRSGGFPYLLHRRKQQRYQHRDDCDHHQQLDQRKSR